MLPTPPETKPHVRAADLESPALAPLGLKLVSGRAGLDNLFIRPAGDQEPLIETEPAS